MTRKTRQPHLPGPYLTGAYLVPERVADFGVFPFSLPYVRDLSIDLDRPVTFFVGENGSGKSTLLEALAEIAGFPSAGGGAADLYRSDLESTTLAGALRPRFRHRPPDGFFFRAENLVQFASVLEERQRDPDFIGDPYARYGGRSLHTRSHGEAFLSVFTGRVERGLFLLDEPESALSPQRQLALMMVMRRQARLTGAQFIVATHSPILLTYPGAAILDFDAPGLPAVRAEDTAHVTLTRDILASPEAYWRRLDQAIDEE